MEISTDVEHNGAILIARIRLVRPDAQLPTRGHASDVGFDCYAYTEGRKPGEHPNGVVGPNTTRAVKLGIAVTPPAGYFFALCSRSGLAGQSVFISNAPGIIDPGYTGELVALLHNSGHGPFYYAHGDRVAQLVLLPVVSYSLTLVEELASSDRGAAGFGSTGK